jgi:hypothetical protein
MPALVHQHQAKVGAAHAFYERKTKNLEMDPLFCMHANGFSLGTGPHCLEQLL